MRFVLLSILACINSVYGQSWKNYADTAKSFSDQKNNAKSIEYYLKANDLLKKDSAATLSYMRNNNDIADLYVATGQYAKAEPFYVEGKLLSDTLLGKESADYATSCNNLGRVYRLLGQYEKSELLLLDAKRIREKIF